MSQNNRQMKLGVSISVSHVQRTVMLKFRLNLKHSSPFQYHALVPLRRVDTS
ncbi:hypothetical protein SAMN05421578_11394 [Paenibacillus macquariensis]|uniref:Uncharacterized protein n=1 Tax=Paenibacillus macquariensis TaxID=948756 RepID=A0ABY1K8K9_9BACL|nr:hypothetical protein SAMN05421578_11394 [Paenibacillus macquariensis]